MGPGSCNRNHMRPGILQEYTADQYPLEPGGGAAAYDLDGVPAIIYFTVLDIMGLKEYKKTDDAGKFNREEEEKE